MSNNFYYYVKNNWQIMTISILSLIVLVLIFSLIQPLQYRSRVELLIIQKQTLALDAYAAARASEKLANNLSSVIATQSFFDKVINTNFGIQRTDFPLEEKELRKVWQKKIKTNVSPQANILSIDVFDKNKNKADQLANAIAYVLVNQSAEYHGGGEDVVVKVVNQPLVSNYPVKPNVLLNISCAIILGLVLSLGWVIYRNKNLMFQNDAVQKFDLSQEDELGKRIRTMWNHATVTSN